MRYFKTIAIIGLGLMGASLAAACRRKFPRATILGVTRRGASLRTARRKRWIHRGYSAIGPSLRSADLHVLATPVDTFPRLLNQLERHAKTGALVTDVGSVKGELLQGVSRRRFRRIHFVGAHPMVGSHRRGIDRASPRLYEEGFTFLIRSRQSDPRAYGRVKTFWKKISPRVIEIGAAEHDRIVARTSHLPHLAAVALMLAVPGRWLRFASKGFLDTTRVAAGHASIWLPIFQGNRAAVQRALAMLESHLKKIRAALGRRDNRALSGILRAASRKRGQISL